MRIKIAMENIKEAKFSVETKEEAKEMEELFGPVNSTCPICGYPIRNSEGFVCSNCNWEVGLGNPVSKSTYKLLFKLLRRV